MTKETPKYAIWIEAESWVPGEWTLDDDSTDVIVSCEDGSRRIATFISYKYITTLAERNRRSGENISGAYLWIRDLILIDEVSRQQIELVVSELISSGNFELAFRSCSDEDLVVFQKDQK